MLNLNMIIMQEILKKICDEFALDFNMRFNGTTSVVIRIWNMCHLLFTSEFVLLLQSALRYQFII